jgi:hypothetical protein
MKKTVLLLTAFICMIIILAVPLTASVPTYLFLTGVENTIDEQLIARIKALGFDVVVKSHEDFDAAADSAGKVAIYISESVTSGNIVDKFNNIAIPIITSEAYIYDDMGLTLPTAETDFGSNTASISGKVVKPDHPIMKGVATDFKFVTREDIDPPPNVCWGIVPASNVLAADPDIPERAIIFAYEKGEKSMEALFPSYAFPEKRAAIALHTTFVDSISPDMWKIFDNAVIWAAGVDPLAPPPVEESNDSENPDTADVNIMIYIIGTFSAVCGLFALKNKITEN